MLVDSHDFGYIASGIKRENLYGSFRPTTSGFYTLEIENTRSVASSTCIYNYIDNISLKPSDLNLMADKVNIPCLTGDTVNFDLRAGAANAGKDYWVLFNYSGTFPGVNYSGINIPLNMDALFLFALKNPSFAGSTGMTGQLSPTGYAPASVDMPKDYSLGLVGIPINFAYVLLEPGPSTPITYASIPVHIKYIP